jgi:hypothetical protein
MNSITNKSIQINTSMNSSFDLNIYKMNLSDIGVECLSNMGYTSLTQLGLLFYIHNPYDHFFENANDVRNYEIWVSFTFV